MMVMRRMRTQSKHKEQVMNRKKLDADDREKIRKEFKKYINPLQPETDKLVNIVNGCIADDKINVHNAIAIGQKAATKFRESLPEDFYKPLHQEVVTMETMKKGVRIGEKVVV